MSRRWGLIPLLLGGFFWSGSAAAQPPSGPGYDAGEIRIGHIVPYSGPAAAYGVIGETLTAYFDKVNAEGGVNGRRIRFFSYDDGYSPPRTVEQARRLVERDDVLLIFNPLGAPPNLAIRDYLNEARVPQLFLAAGATIFDDPGNYPWTLMWNPAGFTEGAIIARYVVANLPEPKLGILYQNDDFGSDLLAGVKSVIAADVPITALSYEITDPNVDAQVLNLRAGGANTFLIFATPRAAAQAIRRAAEIGWKPLTFTTNVAASRSAVLEPAGLENATGLLAVSYFMDPSDPSWNDHPAKLEWLDFMAEYYPRGDILNAQPMYGYIVGQVLVEVLRRAGDDLSRENVLRMATSLKDLAIPQLLPGVTVNTAPDDYRPIETLSLRRFDGNAWRIFGDLINASD